MVNETACSFEGNPGELISFLGGRAVDAHLSEPTCLDSNQWLMLFVSTAPGGNDDVINHRWKKSIKLNCNTNYTVIKTNPSKLTFLVRLLLPQQVLSGPFFYQRPDKGAINSIKLGLQTKLRYE
jgi:hypothetical protein